MKRFCTLILALLLCFSLTPSAFAAGGADAAEAAQPLDAVIALPERAGGRTDRITDGVLMSHIDFRSDETVSVSFEVPAQGVYIQWYRAPASGTLTEMDAAGATVAEAALEFPYLNTYLELDPACRSLTLAFSEACALSELSVFSADGALPDTVQRWSPAPEKADLMVVVSEPGPELSSFSGLLPLYAGACKLDTVVVYMSTFEKRSRAEEGLSGLSGAGIETYPVFLERYARNYNLLEIVEEDWGKGDTTEALRQLFEQYRPEIVVTHDGADTDAFFATRGFAARCVEDAAKEASWRIKKLYERTDAAGATVSDATVPDYSAPLARFDGNTALEAANALYAGYATQQTFVRTVDEHAGFRLVSSEVGPDEAKNDLLEHIDLASLSGYEAPEAPAPTPAEAPAATAAPVPALEAEQASAPTGNAPGAVAAIRQTATIKNLLPVMVGVVLTLVLLVVLRRSMKKWSAVLLAFAPTAAGLIVYFALLHGTIGLDTAGSLRKRAEATPTPAPTAVPTAAPTPTATPEPTPAPTPEEEAYYLADNDPGEVVTADAESGHWSYQTNRLSIRIDRVHAETEAGKPLTYFVADIRMKDISEFRPAFGSDGHTGMGAIYPWIIARRARAVLWITGDNMVNSDREEKGVILRDGRLFLDEEIEDTMALYPDMSLRIYKKWNQNADEFLQDGVENTFSFGPTLVEDGVANPDARKHRVRRANPRVGIGMLEPGHFIAIVVDGRQKNYSVGLPVEDFADMFVEYGCTTAYNMDGGLSAGMIFMGEQLNSHGGKRVGAKNDLSYQRPVPDGLIFGYSTAVPSVDDPILNNGNVEK